jgi:hypothetical protein
MCKFILSNFEIFDPIDLYLEILNYNVINGWLKDL